MDKNAAEGGALTWREVVEKHHSVLVDELSVRLDSELREAVSVALPSERSKAATQLKQACDEARRSQVESLNQVLRRLRTTGEEQVLDLVAEGCASYSPQAVVLVFENNQARSAAGFGVEYNELSFDTALAPAIVAAIDSRDPVVALGTASRDFAGAGGCLPPRAGPEGVSFPRGCASFSCGDADCIGRSRVRAHRVVVRSGGNEARSV